MADLASFFVTKAGKPTITSGILLMDPGKNQPPFHLGPWFLVGQKWSDRFCVGKLHITTYIYIYVYNTYHVIKNRKIQIVKFQLKK